MQSSRRHFFFSMLPKYSRLVAGETASIDPMATHESIQQSSAGSASRSLLHRPWRQPAIEAADRRRTRQRINLLPGAGEHLQRPELSEPQSLVHPANAESERSSNPRRTSWRNALDGNCSHSNESDQNCEFLTMLFMLLLCWPVLWLVLEFSYGCDRSVDGPLCQGNHIWR